MKLKNYLLRTLLFCVTMLTGGGQLWAETTILSFNSGTLTGASASYAGTGTLDGGNKYKFGNSDSSAGTNYVQLTLTSGTFQTGDAISIQYYANSSGKNVNPALFFGTLSGTTLPSKRPYRLERPLTLAVLLPRPISLLVPTAMAQMSCA